MITIRMLREQLQDSEFYYDKNREVVFKCHGKTLKLHGSTVTEDGPVVIEFKEDHDDKHL